MTPGDPVTLRFPDGHRLAATFDRLAAVEAQKDVFREWVIVTVNGQSQAFLTELVSVAKKEVFPAKKT